MRNRELNNVRISNPDGICKKHREPNKFPLKNMRHGAIQEDSSRSFRETVHVAEFRERGRVEKPDKRPKKRKQKSNLISSSASMAGHALMMVTAVAFCSVVYVSSLTIRVRPCSSMAHALAFQTSFRNPDSTPLRAELYSEQENYSKDFVGVAYLLFEGLTEKTAYGLDIVNVETEEKIYQSTFLTAEKDPYQIQVEDPHMTDDGLFQFGLAVDGLAEGAFYTVYVMDGNGKKIAVLDCSDTRTSFSIPVKSFTPPTDATEQPSDETGQPSSAIESPPGQDAQPSEQNEHPHDETQSPEQGEQSPDEAQPPEQGEQFPDEAQPPEQGEQSPDEAQPPEQDEQSPDEVQPPDETTPQPDVDTLPFITVKINGKTFLPHVWGEEPEPNAEPVPESEAGPVVEPPDDADIAWVWNEEHTEAEALIPDPENPEQPEIVRAEVTETVVKEAGCTEEGLVVYEADVPGENGTEYSDVQTVVIPAKGHHYERVKLDQTQSGTSAEYVCSNCGKSYSIDVSATEEAD